MKYLSSLCFLLFTVLPGQALAQELDTSAKWSVKAGYFGEFVMHPGLYVGSEYVINQWGGTDLHWDNELVGYSHRRNNSAFIVQSLVGVRFTGKRRVYADISTGLGFMLSAPQGDFYRVNEDGDLVETGRPYSSHAKPTIHLGFGWNGLNRKVPMTIGMGFEGYWQTHFNGISLPHFALQLGVTYRLKGQEYE